MPARYARIINMAVCRMGVRIQNEFYEVLEAGIGLQPGTNCSDWCGAVEGFERGVWPTQIDLTSTNQKLRVYYTDPSDIGKRLLIQGLDSSGNIIRSVDGSNHVIGEYLTLSTPFTDSIDVITQITGIQKDVTIGDVLLYQVDQTTGATVLLSRYLANETNPAYRRYFINRTPCTCCNVPCTCTPQTVVPGSVNVTALAKLEYFPVSQDTDNLIIGNIPALKEECMSIRYSEMDVQNSLALTDNHHKRAVRLLQQELDHYLGKQYPSINVAPFGTASLDCINIGMI